MEIVIIGTAIRAMANINGVASENVTAICDVDDEFLDRMGERFDQAHRFNDIREMLDVMKFDAVVVSTADHTHAASTLRALKQGAHVYCEKPLTHTVAEARQVAERAREKKAVTQMGTQIHAGNNYRRVVELVRSGAIGSIREAHCWVGKAWGGGERPTGIQPTPANFQHDLWIGPAPFRPYHDFYHPAQWRRFWDFGNGTLGDMGCHHLDLPFWALDLRHPIRVSAEGPPLHKETAPEAMSAHWDFPERMGFDGRKWPAMTLHWHDGGRLPAQFSDENLGLPKWGGGGTLFVGEQGMLLADYGRYLLFPQEKFVDFEAPEPSIPSSVGHYKEWLDAIRAGGGATTCNFDYSGALTETVLLGCVAFRAGEAFDWNGATLRASSAKAQALVAREVREGWQI
ncbi:MAG: Gfo/Idh/MocA family oxidoreductase [Planctomycetes bacterium]|nr:Gfo/Idh/MocA family oxidoreductase [Planctomycetota bacterium]